MIPFTFILVAAVVLTMLVYWILSTSRDDEYMKSALGDLNYEIASELATNGSDELYLAQNTIKIQLSENKYGLVFWQLNRVKWEEVCAEHGLKPDMRHLVLRLAEVGERVNYSDMWVMTTAGQYRFSLHPQHSYYLSLGIKQNQVFIPILTSNTIRLYKSVLD